LLGDVAEVQLNALVEVDVAAPGDLPQAGHAGVDAQAREVIVLVAVGVERGRPRADQAHVTAHHVEQVGQFIEAGAPQETADTGDAWVLVDLEIDGVDPVLVEVTQRFLQLFGVADHGAELVHAEGAAAITGAFLHEHHRSRAGEFDGQCQAQQQRREHHQQQQCTEAGQYPVGA
jgi:hypothetical protein